MGFWEFFDKNFVSVITLLSAILGALVGGLITYMSQKNIIQKQIDWDKEKNRMSQIKETLEVYNKLLEIDGSKYIINHNNGHQLEILLGEYKQSVRPVLYEKFHQLHQNVADKVSAIDYQIDMCNFMEELSDEHSEMLAGMYISLIDMIKVHLKEYRENESNH